MSDLDLYTKALEVNASYNQNWRQCEWPYLIKDIVDSGAEFNDLVSNKVINCGPKSIHPRAFKPLFHRETLERYISNISYQEDHKSEGFRFYESKGLVANIHYGSLLNLDPIDYVAMSLCNFSYNKHRIRLYDGDTYKAIPYSQLSNKDFILINKSTMEANICTPNLDCDYPTIEVSLGEGLKVYGADITNVVHVPNKKLRKLRRKEVDALCYEAKTYAALTDIKVDLFSVEYFQLTQKSSEEIFEYMRGCPEGLIITYLSTLTTEQLPKGLNKYSKTGGGYYHCMILTRCRRIIKQYMDYRDEVVLNKILVT